MVDPIGDKMGDARRHCSGGSQTPGTRRDGFRVQVEQWTFDRQHGPSSGRKRGYRQKKVVFWNLQWAGREFTSGAV